MKCATCSKIPSLMDRTDPPLFECRRCHRMFCPDCMTLQRDLAGDLDPLNVCFACDGVTGAVGHRRRQGVHDAD